MSERECIVENEPFLHCAWEVANMGALQPGTRRAGLSSKPIISVPVHVLSVSCAIDVRVVPAVQDELNRKPKQ